MKEKTLKDLSIRINGMINDFENSETRGLSMLEEFAEVTKLHKEMGKKAFQEQDFNLHKIARIKIDNLLDKLFKDLDELETYSRSIFVQGKGYNVVVAIVEKGKYNNILSHKTFNWDIIETLINKYGFMIKG